LGQNFLENYDVEYDLGHGAIRLFKTAGCEHSRLAYWLTPGQQYSTMAIAQVSRSYPFTRAVGYINNLPINIHFDTGAGNSLLSANAAAITDLESVDRLAPKQADLRFALAQVYERIDHLAEAIRQYGLWLDSHPDDSRLLAALGGRCVDRAMLNQDLDAAGKDCDKAILRADKRDPNSAVLWVDRALVRIRTADSDRAIADCNQALKMSPKNARALYVRSIAEAKMQMPSASRTDLAEAETISAKIGERFERHGFTH
jgi:tetratricopeptide (TPR) repeat protein